MNNKLLLTLSALLTLAQTPPSLSSMNTDTPASGSAEGEAAHIQPTQTTLSRAQIFLEREEAGEIPETLDQTAFANFYNEISADVHVRLKSLETHDSLAAWIEGIREAAAEATVPYEQVIMLDSNLHLLMLQKAMAAHLELIEAYISFATAPQVDGSLDIKTKNAAIAQLNYIRTYAHDDIEKHIIAPVKIIREKTLALQKAFTTAVCILLQKRARHGDLSLERQKQIDILIKLSNLGHEREFINGLTRVREEALELVDGEPFTSYLAEHDAHDPLSRLIRVQKECGQGMRSAHSIPDGIQTDLMIKHCILMERACLTPGPEVTDKVLFLKLANYCRDNDLGFLLFDLGKSTLREEYDTTPEHDDADGKQDE